MEGLARSRLQEHTSEASRSCVVPSEFRKAAPALSGDKCVFFKETPPKWVKGACHGGSWDAPASREISLSALPSVRELLAAIFRNVRWIALALIVPPVVAVVLAFSLPKLYQADAKLLIKPGREF